MSRNTGNSERASVGEFRAPRNANEVFATADRITFTYNPRLGGPLPDATLDFYTDLVNRSMGKMKIEIINLSDNDEDDDSSDYDIEEENQKDPYYEREELSEIACEYCKIHNPACVVMCNICKKWFCSSTLFSSDDHERHEGSHIVEHLERAKHTEVTLHEDGPSGETVLECSTCGSRNVFNLGFKSTETGKIVLYCRTHFGAQKSWKNLKKQAHLKPVIEDRNFVSQFVNPLSRQFLFRAREVTLVQIAKLEELWKDDIDATFADVEKLGVDVEPRPVLLRYGDRSELLDVFGPLINEEEVHAKGLRKSLTQDDITVRWKSLPNKKVEAYFKLAKTDEDVKVRLGDKLRLRYMGDVNKPWSEVGYVIKLPDINSEEVGLEMKTNRGIPFELTSKFSVDFLWISTAFDRQQQALRIFAVGFFYLSRSLYKALIGNNSRSILDTLVGDDSDRELLSRDFKYYSAPNLPNLSRSQVDAVKHAVQKPLSLIWGNTGTGKTVVSAAIVYQLVKLNRGPVLVCAPWNKTVDDLTEKIHKTNLKVVRVCAVSKETIDSPVAFLALHNQIENLDSHSELKKLQKLREETGELSAADGKRYRALKISAERKILEAADVICCTCIAAGDPRLARIRFHSVLIDDSTQATEPECLIPVMLGTKQIILVGDPRQLGPIVLSKKALKAGLRQSLFERLVAIDIEPFRLEVQYRMHPALSYFPSKFFYDGSLKNGVRAEERTLEKIKFPWPVPNIPMLFYVTKGAEEIAGSSYLNRTEASKVEEITARFLQCGAKPEQIGIITPYVGQRAYLVQRIRCLGDMNTNYQQIEVATVDAFAGRVKDIIIISCVRSDGQGIGFLNDSRRLNVALTRAKYGLIIIGNPKVLSKLTLWNQLLNYCRERKVLVEGPLSDLAESAIQFAKPK